jgi:hypothetical protein
MPSRCCACSTATASASWATSRSRCVFITGGGWVGSGRERDSAAVELLQPALWLPFWIATGSLPTGCRPQHRRALTPPLSPHLPLPPPQTAGRLEAPGRRRRAGGQAQGQGRRLLRGEEEGRGHPRQGRRQRLGCCRRCLCNHHPNSRRLMELQRGLVGVADSSAAAAAAAAKAAGGFSDLQHLELYFELKQPKTDHPASQTVALLQAKAAALLIGQSKPPRHSDVSCVASRWLAREVQACRPVAAMGLIRAFAPKLQLAVLAVGRGVRLGKALGGEERLQLGGGELRDRQALDLRW